MMRIANPLIGHFSRAPARLQTKLLAAFLAIVTLLILMGAAGLRALSEVNQRAEELVRLQRTIEAYSQVQHDTLSHLYTLASALLLLDEQALDNTLRQVTHFGYRLDRLAFLAKEEGDLIEFRKEIERFIKLASEVVELIRSGRAKEAREMQVAEVAPLADALERLTNQLVNKAEANMIAGIEESQRAYMTSRWVLLASATGSLLLALLLGHAISWSVLGPIGKVEMQLNRIAAGDFTQRIHIMNRDELGALAAHLNRTCDELARLYQELESASRQLRDWNAALEERVAGQVQEIERIGRLRRFLPPQVAELVISSRDGEAVLQSHRRDVTVMFCDLRGFTAFAETAEPEEVMAILRDYHACLGELIFEYGGTLERFVGDGVLVVMNDPIPYPDHPARTVRMALEMRDGMRTMTEGWRRRGHELGFGIGIAQGYATLGQIGFEGRLDYAAIGTIPNLASRLCGEAGPGQILISQRVFTSVENEVEATPVGELILKGFHRPVPAYQLIGLRSNETGMWDRSAS